MKKYFLTLFLAWLFSMAANSQDSLLYKFEGYVGKTKLKDVTAVYGEAAFTSKATILVGTLLRQFVFDYGQYYKKDKEATVTKENGDIITFGSIAHVLNFFDYKWLGVY